MTSSDIASELRTLIWDIRDLYRELPDTIAHIAGLHAVRYDKRGTGKSTSTDVTIIGGAALVMASAGYDGGVTSARDGNRDHAHDCLPDDPPSVLAILTRIEDVWRTNQHNPAAETTSLDATVNFLLANAPWAAEHHPDINDDLHDLDQLRNRLRTVTGRDDTPKTHEVPCIYCAGTVVQQWTNEGLKDEAICTRCRRTWPDEQRLKFTNRYALLMLPETHPDTLVTIDEAKAVLPDARRGTLDTWARRGRENPDQAKFPILGRSVRGEPLYRLGDIHTAWLTRDERAVG